MTEKELKQLENKFIQALDSYQVLLMSGKFTFAQLADARNAIIDSMRAMQVKADAK